MQAGTCERMVVSRKRGAVGKGRRSRGGVDGKGEAGSTSRKVRKEHVVAKKITMSVVCGVDGLVERRAILKLSVSIWYRSHQQRFDLPDESLLYSPSSPSTHMCRLARRRRSCRKCSSCNRATNSSVVASWIGHAALIPMSGVNGHDCERSSCGSKDYKQPNARPTARYGKWRRN